jgi:hypothetical protein
VQIGDGSTISLWNDLWNAKVRIIESPELYSITINKATSVKQAKDLKNLHDIFQLPMTNEAFQQYVSMLTKIDNLDENTEIDKWTYL